MIPKAVRNENPTCRKKDCAYCNRTDGNRGIDTLLKVLNLKNTHLKDTEYITITLKSK